MTNLPQPRKLALQPSYQTYDLHEMLEHPIEEDKECEAWKIKIKLKSHFRHINCNTQLGSTERESVEKQWSYLTEKCLYSIYPWVLSTTLIFRVNIILDTNKLHNTIRKYRKRVGRGTVVLYHWKMPIKYSSTNTTLLKCDIQLHVTLCTDMFFLTCIVLIFIEFQRVLNTTQLGTIQRRSLT